jgi:DNA-binding MarR family transcriptional regulator
LQAYLTERGEELVSRAHALVEAVEECMLAELGEDERLKLAEALRSCADSLAPGGAGSRAR